MGYVESCILALGHNKEDSPIFGKIQTHIPHIKTQLTSVLEKVFENDGRTGDGQKTSDDCTMCLPCEGI